MEVVSRQGAPTWSGLEDSAAGAAAALTATLTSAAGRRAYIAGLAVTGTGATAALTIEVTVTGLAVTLRFKVVVPAGAGVEITRLIVPFGVPIPASADGTNIVVNVPSFGAGNLNAAVAAWGLLQ